MLPAVICVHDSGLTAAFVNATNGNAVVQIGELNAE